MPVRLGPKASHCSIPIPSSRHEVERVSIVSSDPFLAPPQSLFQAYAKDRQDLLGGIGLHQIGTDAAIIEEFRNRSPRAEMRLKLVFWQAEKDNELDRLVYPADKKKLDIFSRIYQNRRH